MDSSTNFYSPLSQMYQRSQLYVQMIPNISAKMIEAEPVRETKTVYKAVFSKIAQHQLNDHEERIETLELQLQRIHNRVTNLEMRDRRLDW